MSALRVLVVVVWLAAVVWFLHLWNRDATSPNVHHHFDFISTLNITIPQTTIKLGQRRKIFTKNNWGIPMKSKNDWDYMGRCADVRGQQLAADPKMCDAWIIDPKVRDAYQSHSVIWNWDNSISLDSPRALNVIDRHMANLTFTSQFYLLSQATMDAPFTAELILTLDRTLDDWSTKLDCEAVLLISQSLGYNKGDPLAMLSVVQYAKKFNYCVVVGVVEGKLPVRTLAKYWSTLTFMRSLLRIKYSAKWSSSQLFPNRIYAIDHDVYFTDFNTSLESVLQPYRDKVPKDPPTLNIIPAEYGCYFLCQFNQVALVNAGFIAWDITPVSALFLTDSIILHFTDFAHCIKQSKYVSSYSEQSTFNELLVVQGFDTYKHVKFTCSFDLMDADATMRANKVFVEYVPIKTKSGRVLGAVGVTPQRVLFAHPSWGKPGNWEVGDVLIHSAGLQKSDGPKRTCIEPPSEEWTRWCLMSANQIKEYSAALPF